METDFNFRNFFGAIERFRDRLLSSNERRFEFEADIFSLTGSQQRLLREVALLTTPDAPGISLKSLAEDLNLSSSAVSVMVEMLVQKKILERKASDVDRRQVLIRLSDAAWEAVDMFDKQCSAFLDTFSEEEIRLLSKISRKLAGGDNFNDNRN